MSTWTIFCICFGVMVIYEAAQRAAGYRHRELLAAIAALKKDEE